jgi:hypothetical protein
MTTSQYIKNEKSKYDGKSIQELVSLHDLAISKMVAFKNGEISEQERTRAHIQYYIVSEILEKKRKTPEFKKYFNL